jgi:hypothetical protein
VVLMLEGALVSWTLAMDERGGHKDLWFGPPERNTLRPREN